MIPGHIFREYDIRGLHATELSDEVAEFVGRAFATLIAEGEPAGMPLTVALGRDVRPSSERLVQAVERGIRAAGVRAERVGVVPTPALYYAVVAHKLAGGLQVTGSHNPPEFNGFKMTRRTLPLFGAEIQTMRERIARGDLASAGAAVGEAEDRPILETYAAMLVERLRSGRPLTVVMDCGNGCAGTVVPQVFERMGHRVIPLFAELDGRFPNHLPDPTVPALLQSLIAEVKRSGADLWLGFDGDADRIGAVDGAGRIVFGDQLLPAARRGCNARS